MNAGTCVESADSAATIAFPAADYDLAATLTSGQVFRWSLRDGGWEGVLQGRWVRLVQTGPTIEARVSRPVTDWNWLREFLQLDLDFAAVRASFPDDEPMQRALSACPGLRLLRQDPWECLISFICSSTKQIVQIQEILRLLCERFGEPVPVPEGHAPAFAFPTPSQLAGLSEAELRACKAGFRAPYLLATARAVVDGQPDLASLRKLDCEAARDALMELPGVGRKIADCVLLFAYGFPGAFPVDVWVEKALQTFYFPRRRVSPERLRRFSETHFGPHSGYAQQYLFHYARTIALTRGQARITRPKVST